MDKGEESWSKNKEQIRNVNKVSHKISKPTRRPCIDPPPPSLPLPHNQPPVYNINRNDFRHVVQQLTGSPAYNTSSQPLMTPLDNNNNNHMNSNSNSNSGGSVSSRLQRIRPPPLAHIGPRPAPQQPPPPANNSWLRPFPPMSPLPPFPAVHAAAESPISAYMRFLQSSTSSCQSPLAFGCLSPLFSPSGLSALPPFPLSPTPLPSPGKRTN